LVAALFYSPGFRRAVRFAPTAQDFNRRFALAYAWSHSKGYFDEIYEAMLVRGLLLNTARAVQWADHHLVDNFVDGLAEGYELAASRVRRLQTGQVQSYTFGLLAGVVLVVVLMLIFASQGNLSPALGVHP
jgi:NADH-quinone oxidoreductase subunit L